MNKGTITSDCSNKVQVFTGQGNCNKQEGKTTALLISEYNAAYPTDGVSFNAALNGYINTDSPLRLLPINNIINNTPSGGDISTTEVGFAGPRPSGYNASSEIYQIDSGDCTYKQIAHLNKKRVRVFRVDDQKSIYGTVVSRGGEEKLVGFDARLMVLRVKGADGSVIYALSLAVYYSVNYSETELPNLHSFPLDEIPTGLIGVTLKKGSTTGTAKVISICDGEDYTSNFGSEWTADMFANASGVSPTSVIYSASTGLLTFVPIAAYKVKDAATLSAGDIQGIEGINSYVSLT